MHFTSDGDTRRASALSMAAGAASLTFNLSYTFEKVRLALVRNEASGLPESGLVANVMIGRRDSDMC